MGRQEPATTTAPARRTFTLMAVHAHPDDESSGTGGLLRLAAAQGHTTVLVTCTNGDLGDVKDSRLRLQPRARPADRQCLAEVRHAELRQAAAILGVTHLYPLGYHDSGMHGWETNTAPHAFAQAKIEEVLDQLVPIMRQHRPDVRRHVVIALGIVREHRIAIAHELRGERLEVATHRRIGVLAHDQRRARVVDPHRREPVADLAVAHDLHDVARDLEGAATGCRDRE